MDTQIFELADSREEPVCSVAYGHITREEFRARLLESSGREAVGYFDDEGESARLRHEHMAPLSEDEDGVSYKFDLEPFDGSQPVTVWWY